MIVGIIFISTKISFLFKPIVVFSSTLFFPILISGFLYFLLNPVVHRLQRLKLPRTAAILVIYLVFIGLVILLAGTVVPAITKQVTSLANDLPKYAKQTKIFFKQLSHSKQYEWFLNQEYVSVNDIEKKLVAYANTLPSQITNSLSSIFGVITNLTVIIATVPFLLFYMFKDGHQFPNSLVKFFPNSYRQPALKLLKDTGDTLAAYVQGQITVALFVGTISFIGYLIIGMPYALILALTIAVMNMIPYVGPILGGAPAILVALFDSPTKAVLALVVIIIAQQMEGNIISPLILGKTLDTHPATIIILLLVAGNLAGVLGMVLAVPFYAVMKTIIINTVKFLKMRKEAREANEA